MPYLQRFRDWYRAHERHAQAAAFALGFIIDSLTLTRVDVLYSNLIFTSYLFLAALGIIARYAYGTGRFVSAASGRVIPWVELAIPFSFGNLLSGYIVSYTKSASLVTSWPFLVALAFLFIGNELFKKRYQLLIFQLSVLFITIFSYLLFFIPVLLRRIGSDMFLLSGAASLVLFTGIVFLLRLIDSRPLQQIQRSLVISVGTIFLLFNVAYFANIIPPLPLSLKAIGVYHSVLAGEKNSYFLQYEPAPWYRPFEMTDRTIHIESGAPAYVYSAIFAPAKLSTTIIHRWSYYDETEKTWKIANTVSFPIIGGRDNGYRGYSFKGNITPGKWRVDVLTLRGQSVGRINFSVVSGTPLSLVSYIVE